MTRDEAAARDQSDPLRSYRSSFVVAEPNLIYLDGNSLGRLPRRTASAVQTVIEDQWGRGLVRSWNEWIAWSQQTGDLLAPLVGALPGEVVMSDQTTRTSPDEEH